MTGPYDDIIDLPRPISRTHRPMPREDRAAQFSPFAALTGYENALQEAERMTACQISLDADEIAAINDILCHLQDTLSQQPIAVVTYFLPDEKKSGGAYVTVTGVVKNIDDIQKTVLLADSTRIPIDSIISITTP